MPSNVSLGKYLTLNFLSVFEIFLSSLSGCIESPTMRVIILPQFSRFSFELGAMQAFFNWVNFSWCYWQIRQVDFRFYSLICFLHPDSAAFPHPNIFHNASHSLWHHNNYCFSLYGILILCWKRFSGYGIYLHCLSIHIPLKIVIIFTRKPLLNSFFIYFGINIFKYFFRHERFQREIFIWSFIFHQILRKLWWYLYLPSTFEIKWLFFSLYWFDF